MILPGFEDFERSSKSEIWIKAATIICDKHKISFDRLQRAEQGDHIIFFVDERLIVKIYVPFGNGWEREKIALENAQTSLKIPEIIAFGEIENYKYLITTRIEGESMTREIWLKLEKAEQVSILRQLAEGLRELHLSDTSKIDFDWDNFIAHQAKTCYERQKACRVNERLLAQIPNYLQDNLKLLPTAIKPVFLHGDIHFGNLRVYNSNGDWQISGMFDFADSLKGFHEYDFLAVCVLMIQGQGALQREFFRAYGYAESEINEDLRKRLMLMSMLYECSDLRRYALRLQAQAVEFSLLELEKAIWNFC